jgi:hypothetical protein
MGNLIAGTWNVKTEETEQTPYGQHKRVVTITIKVWLQTYSDGRQQWRQTELTHWNNVQVHDGTYPADTEYAKTRRDGVAPF